MAADTPVHPLPAPVSYAGTRLIVEMRQAARINDLAHMRQASIDSCEAAGATLASMHRDDFGEGLRVTGIAILAESHIYGHSRPECGYDADPSQALPVHCEAFATTDLQVIEHRCGVRVQDDLPSACAQVQANRA